MKLYWKYFSIHLRSVMQYKTSFLLTVLGQFFTSFTMLFGVYFLMSRFHQVEGFSLAEVLLCFAIMQLSLTVAEVFARGFDLFPMMLGNGEFDRILVRPRNVILQVLGSKMEFSRLGRLIQAILVYAYAIPNCGVHWTLLKVLTLILMNVCGSLVFVAMFVIYASVCFFTIQGLETLNILIYGGREFGQYPFSIYGKWVLRFVTYVFPLALVQYYPLLYITGRSDSLFFVFVPVLALLFWIPSLMLWKIGTKHYQSTGS
ncbi:MAG: ABC transporter permease [Massiliimalia sp.]|jgi:ABC-2 type transport system permease protein